MARARVRVRGCKGNSAHCGGGSSSTNGYGIFCRVRRW